MYQLTSVIGSNLIPLAFYVVALLLAKKSSAASRTLFFVGAGLKLISLIGNARQYMMLARYFGVSGFSSLNTWDWIVYILLTAVFWWLISKQIANARSGSGVGDSDKTEAQYVCRSCGKGLDHWQAECPFCGSYGTVGAAAIPESGADGEENADR